MVHYIHLITSENNEVKSAGGNKLKRYLPTQSQNQKHQN